MTRFVKVQAAGSYTDYEVPTREEYDAAAHREARSFADLFRRVEALEDKITVLSPKVENDDEVYKASMFSIANGEIELSGTEAQHKIFEKSREEINKGLFPKFLTRDKLVLLAIDCGLSVKKNKG